MGAEHAKPCAKQAVGRRRWADCCRRAEGCHDADETSLVGGVAGSHAVVVAVTSRALQRTYLQACACWLEWRTLALPYAQSWGPCQRATPRRLPAEGAESVLEQLRPAIHAAHNTTLMQIAPPDRDKSVGPGPRGIWRRAQVVSIGRRAQGSGYASRRLRALSYDRC